VTSDFCPEARHLRVWTGSEDLAYNPGSGWLMGRTAALPTIRMGRSPAPRQGQRDGPWLPLGK